MIRLTNVGLKYDSGPDVLTDVTFHLRPGSFHFLHGESGAGKTSLLRLMFMSLHPSRGEIRMFNEDITAVKPQKRAQMRRRIDGEAALAHHDVLVRRCAAASASSSRTSGCSIT